MYSTSTAYKTAIKQASRKLDIKIIIGTSTYTSADISNISLEGTIQPSQGFTVGNSTSKILKITFLNKSGLTISGTKLDLQVGVQLVNGTYEYIPFKSYNIDDVTTNDFTTDVTCYDNMIKFEKKYVSVLTYPASLTNVLNEILTGTGIACATTLPSVLVNKIEGYTKREALGFIASYMGGNAVINRDGNLEFKLLTNIASSYTISAGIFTLNKEQSTFSIKQLVCTTNNTDLASGDSSDTASTVSFKNPWMTQARLDTLFSTISTISYLGYNAKWQGDMALDLGDIITLTDRNGNTFVSPILSMKLNFNGFTSEISAKGQTLLRNKTQSSGAQQQEMSRTVRQDDLNNTLKDYITNDGLDNTLTNYPTNSSLDNTLDNYTSKDELEQELAKYGDNLVLNGDFDNYRYDPTGFLLPDGSKLNAKYQILHWAYRWSTSDFEVNSGGVDGGMCLHCKYTSGDEINTTIDLTQVEGKYILIEAYVKTGHKSATFFYLFEKNVVGYKDPWGETYYPSGEHIGQVCYAPQTPKGDWDYIRALVEIPQDATAVYIGTSGGDGEFWLDKVSVKAITNGYKPNSTEMAQHTTDTSKHVNRQTVNFTSNLFTKESDTPPLYKLNISHTLYSKNVSCSAITNTDTNTRELCIIDIIDNQTIKITNDRAFNGNVTIDKLS